MQRDHLLKVSAEPHPSPAPEVQRAQGEEEAQTLKLYPVAEITRQDSDEADDIVLDIVPGSSRERGGSTCSEEGESAEC